MTEDDSYRPIACTLTGTRGDRTKGVDSILAPAYRGANERDDGYTLLFDGADESLSAIATFVANERQCCSFAEYSIDVSPPYEETRLTITGPEGTKQMFREELIDRLEAQSE